MSSTERRKAAIAAHDAELTERLQATTRAIREAEEEAERLNRALQQERIGVIAEASEHGWSHERIGAELGVSKQRIGQLVREYGA